MKVLNSYVIDDSSCLRITFNSSSLDDSKIMQYARKKADCPYFRVMKAQKPYTVFRKMLLNVDGDEELYKLVKIGVIE